MTHPTTRGRPALANQPMVMLAFATVIGLVVRAWPVLRAPFPLHDGGLLYAMIGDIRVNAFALPATTSYNGGELPFAYPPLSLYLSALLNTAGVGVLTILQWAPLVLSIASVPLVFTVLRGLLGPSHAVAGAFAFALMPNSYEWLIVGGGLTRALGLVLALATIHEALRMAAGQPRWRGAAAGIAGGLTALAHPYAAAFALLTVALILIWQTRTASVLRSVVVAGAVSVVIVMPWVFAVMSAHGWDPFLAAGSSRSQVGIPLASVLFQDVTGAAFSVFLGFGLIGMAYQLARGRMFLPVWLFLSAVLIGGGGLVVLMVPLAGLISVALVDVVLPSLRASDVGERGLTRGMAVLLTAGLLASMGFPYVIPTPLNALSDEQRSAMSWVGRNTEADATFVVISGEPWAVDATSEWFPALASRTSVGTAQGFEWTPVWDARKAEAEGLQACAADGRMACVVDWVDTVARVPDYAYIAKGPQLGALSPSDCCARLREEMSTQLEIVYDGPGATILRWPT